MPRPARFSVSQGSAAALRSRLGALARPPAPQERRSKRLVRRIGGQEACSGRRGRPTWGGGGGPGRPRLRSLSPALPALPGADFNFTLPIMVGEFLLLMVFLDKFWFGPVGAVLDARDAELRGKLGLVKGNGAEVGGRAARSTAQATQRGRWQGWAGVGDVAGAGQLARFGRRRFHSPGSCFQQQRGLSCATESAAAAMAAQQHSRGAAGTTSTPQAALVRLGK